VPFFIDHDDNPFSKSSIKGIVAGIWVVLKFNVFDHKLVSPTPQLAYTFTKYSDETFNGCKLNGEPVAVVNDQIVSVANLYATVKFEVALKLDHVKSAEFDVIFDATNSVGEIQEGIASQRTSSIYIEPEMLFDALNANLEPGAGFVPK